jgi:hypothetical protein
MSDMTEEGGWTRGKIGKGRTMGKRRARNIKVEKKSKHSKQQHKRRDIFFFFCRKIFVASAWQTLSVTACREPKSACSALLCSALH